MKPLVPSTSPPTPSPVPTKTMRKTRITKACDRCRLKKCKCDGHTPCTRCRSDNTVCIFGARKSAHQKRSYPRGYVFQLECQQVALVEGLHMLYQRAVKGLGWVGEPLGERMEASGRVLTHEILERLGVLEAFGEGGGKGVEEDVGALRGRMMVKEEGEGEGEYEEGDDDEGESNGSGSPENGLPPPLLWGGSTTTTTPTTSSSRHNSGGAEDFVMFGDDGFPLPGDAMDPSSSFADPSWLLQDGPKLEFDSMFSAAEPQKLLHPMPSWGLNDRGLPYLAEGKSVDYGQLQVLQPCGGRVDGCTGAGCTHDDLGNGVGLGSIL